MVTGKEFRKSLRRPMPSASKRATPRVVPAFTIQALQKDVTVIPPPKAGTFVQRPPKAPTQFRRFYMRGDFPVGMEFDTYGNKIAWKVRDSPQYSGPNPRTAFLDK
jgi:hypothetical protein